MSKLGELITLMDDSLSNRVAKFGADAAGHADDAVRDAFFEILGEEKLTWQSYRNNKNAIYTVIENFLAPNLPKAWEQSPFYNTLVEVKNGLLGDQNEFIVNDNSILVASSFSGNHWDTHRQKLEARKGFSVPTEWIYIHVYDELERFLKGNVTLAEMMAKLQKGFNNEIDSRVAAAFTGIGTYLPAAFKQTGAYSRDVLMSLIQKVEVATQQPVIVAGTRAALGEIANGINANWVSNSQKEEVATTGMLIDNLGVPASAIMIPQTFTRGTYNFAINDKMLYVLPANTKPIKLFYEGDVRALDLDSQQTHDQTFDSQVQVKVGTGIICDNLMAQYTLL